MKRLILNWTRVRIWRWRWGRAMFNPREAFLLGFSRNYAADGWEVWIGPLVVLIFNETIALIRFRIKRRFRRAR